MHDGGLDARVIQVLNSKHVLRNILSYWVKVRVRFFLYHQRYFASGLFMSSIAGQN